MRKVSSLAKKYDDVPVAYLTISITIDELAKHWNGYSEEFKKDSVKAFQRRNMPMILKRTWTHTPKKYK